MTSDRLRRALERNRLLNPGTRRPAWSNELSLGSTRKLPTSLTPNYQIHQYLIAETEYETPSVTIRRGDDDAVSLDPPGQSVRVQRREQRQVPIESAGVTVDRPSASGREQRKSLSPVLKVRNYGTTDIVVPRGEN